MALTATQHQARYKGVGSSDAAAALGLSQWKTQYQLHYEKTHPAPPREEQDSDERRRWGTLLEDAIAQRVSEIEKRSLQRVNRTLVCKAHPFMLAHIDRAMPDRQNTIVRWNANAGRLNNAERLIEIKNSVSDWEYGEDGTDDVPLQYLVQCVHQMVVTGVRAVTLAVLFRGSDLRRFSINYSQEIADMVIEGERKFWHMVETNTPPPKTSLADVKLAYPISKAVEKEAPADIVEALKQYRTLDASVTAWEKERDALELRVKDFLGNADTLTVMGFPVVTWKTQGRVTIDAARLRADKPDIAKQYEKTGTSRVFRTKNAKDEK